MFGFFHSRSFAEARKILQRYMNRQFAGAIAAGPRQTARGAFTRPVWVIPVVAGTGPRYEEAYAAVTKDIAGEGLALISTAPVEDKELVIGLYDGELLDFVRCHVTHRTPAGLGFYFIGLRAREVAYPPANVVRSILQRTQEFAEDHALVAVT